MPDLDRIVRDALVFARLNPHATEEQLQDFIDVQKVEDGAISIEASVKHLLVGDYLPWHIVCVSAFLYDRGTPPAESELSRYIRQHPSWA
jgi:hypothetical protein